MRQLITITIEGFGTGLVGAYGANTAVTPCIDALAARGIVLDQCFLDSTDIERQLSSLATGCHALQPSNGQATIWQRLSAVSLPSIFITDSPRAARWAEHAGCAQVLLVEPTINPQPPADPSECAALGLFAAAANVIEQLSSGLIWVHSLGFQLPWDAPLELRAQFIDPEDPQPPVDVGPPAFDITNQVDPDLVTGWGQVAAAQAALFDDAIGSLMATVEARDSSEEQWAWIILGLGGVPLGEHGRLGWGRPQLHAEELQCMAIIRPSPPPDIGWRRAELCQLPDVAATMMECCGLSVDSPMQWGNGMLPWSISDTPKLWLNSHKLAMLRLEDGTCWIRSPAWSGLLPPIIWDAATSDLAVDLEAVCDSAQLYVKPDDRWEVSQIAARCPEIVDLLRKHAIEFLQAATSHDRDALSLVDDALCNLMR